MSYPRFASYCLPPVAAVLGLFIYMRLTEPERACAEVEPSQPVSKPIQTTPDETKRVFEQVYDTAVWSKPGDFGTSGSGSTLQATYVYRQYLKQFMRDNNIKSVVDAGCGDWEFSQKIDWTGIDYKGYDIVAKVVEANKKQFAKPGVEFFVGNIVEDDLPAADLLISKHVLQHLPNADVKKFLDKQTRKYKHVLLTNGVHPVLMTARNLDTKPGGYRWVDITQPPFDVRAKKPLTWFASGHMHQVTHIDNTTGR